MRTRKSPRHEGFKNMRRSALCIALLACVAHAGFVPGALAQDEKIRELFQELPLGESVYPQEKGELQFTTGFRYPDEESDNWGTPVFFEYGITDYFQIGLEIPIQSELDDGE